MFHGFIIIIIISIGTIMFQTVRNPAKEKGKKKKKKVHGSIGLIVPEMIVETNGTRRAKCRKLQQKKQKKTR